ncbi:hydrolase 1, exosortase A system-associated [Emcibacter nanhaiensis]|uniref:Hydrolase 1, exosortase A system-associated n=1 Tax=Emcibacter nanhaiensis TaxID=1505037 RepID=A0A501PBC0_9PROT|nr:hydrolase 1, exosortase A system-associated [Emcibacter nanhaiensis]TPD57337.1 hydrolase 1, exosortase A system-associated [Emcibacter nanhaiensis]
MTDSFNEEAFAFDIHKETVTGIIHHAAPAKSDTGLLIVVGGPQYRIGAHRQYVHLARHSARRGVPAMRFDYRGIGDSSGDYPGFQRVSEDIHRAVDEFLAREPAINNVVIWGLCEGASACLLGAQTHPAVSGLGLANPWVRSEAGLARAYVKHYYTDRLKDPEFWKKLFSGKMNITGALGGLLSNIKKALGGRFPAPAEDTPSTPAAEIADENFPDRMLAGLQGFNGRVLLVQCDNDLVAREFDDLVKGSRDWQAALKNRDFARVDIPESDHTFSSEVWRQAVADATLDWLLNKGAS